MEYMEETLKLFFEKFDDITKYFHYLGFTINEINIIKNKLVE